MVLQGETTSLLNRTVVILCVINQLWQLCTAQSHNMAKQSYVKPPVMHVYMYRSNRRCILNRTCISPYLCMCIAIFVI